MPCITQGNHTSRRQRQPGHIQEGLPFEGALRVVLPRLGFTPCTWLITLSRDDLIERAGTLSPES